MIFPILFFLILQVFVHGEKWRASDWLGKTEKTNWAFVRGFLFFASAVVYTTLKEGNPCCLIEASRVFLLMNLLFWISFDILLPAYAGKPQLWEDSNLADNNSPFDKIGGNWKVNLLIKISSILIILVWMAETEPNELFPNIPLNLELNLPFIPKLK